MRIEGSEVVMGAVRERSVAAHDEVAVEAWKAPVQRDVVTLSPQAQQALVSPCTCDDEQDIPGASPRDQLLETLVEKMIEALTGRKVDIQLMSDEDLHAPRGTPPPEAQRPGEAPESPPAEPGAGPVGWGLSIDAVHHREVHERVSFSAKGRVRTKDGTEIDLDVDLTMRRDLVEHEEFHLRAGDAVMKDPLILDFDGDGAELGATRFRFDLDADGVLDELPAFGPGDGMLVDDRDGDGVIADGSEVVGAISGDGFGDLAGADADHNGWIDEADPLFARLRVAFVDADGSLRTMRLADAGVGALSVARAKTAFTLADRDGVERGRIGETGLWLGEDGRVGAVQHVDLKV